jgi:hypothetical protein
MKTLQLYYATNRNHLGDDRWKPTGYGTNFSDDGLENLRFGYLELDVDETVIATNLAVNCGFGTGSGNKLAEALTPLIENGGARIEAFEEAIVADQPDDGQPPGNFGSQAMFDELKTAMMAANDVLIYIHGFNVSWSDAVASSLALQESLNQSDPGKPDQKVMVVLFTWPSDGKALPYVSYMSDRAEAKASGAAVGRGFLKARDFLFKVRTLDARGLDIACGQDLHLLCHSMGNYVLQCALERMAENTPGTSFPRLFAHIFMCAADVDDNVLEDGQPLGSVQELAQNVSVYSNKGDVAVFISHYTKGNPERLGHNGPAHPALLHNKVHSVNCTPIVTGLIEHSYYQDGKVNQDIRLSIAAVPFDAPIRQRVRDRDLPNVWSMK